MNYNGIRVPGCDYSAPAIDKLPDLIGAKPMTVRDISIELGRSQKSMDTLFSKLHAAGRVHVAKWQRGSSGPIAAMYLWGEGEDAPRPKPYTTAQKCRRYRQSGGAKSARKTRLTNKAIKTGGLAAIDPLLAAVMGQSPKKEQTCT